MPGSLAPCLGFKAACVEGHAGHIPSGWPDQEPAGRAGACKVQGCLESLLLESPTTVQPTSCVIMRLAGWLTGCMQQLGAEPHGLSSKGWGPEKLNLQKFLGGLRAVVNANIICPQGQPATEGSPSSAHSLSSTLHPAACGQKPAATCCTAAMRHAPGPRPLSPQVSGTSLRRTGCSQSRQLRVSLRADGGGRRGSRAREVAGRPHMQGSVMVCPYHHTSSASDQALHLAGCK